MSQQSQSLVKDTICDLCGRYFAGTKGRNIHISRVHKSAQDPILVSVPLIPADPPVSLVDELKQLRKSSRIIRRIPHNIRTSIALELCTVVSECVENNSVASWRI